MRATVTGMVAVVPVRSGLLPLGGDEAVAETGGAAVLIGDGVDEAAKALAGVATDLVACEVGAFAPAAWALALAGVTEVRHAGVVVLPASPDGRDLAPRLAHALDRPLFASAIRITPTAVDLARRGGLVIETHAPSGPFVATLQPGVRGVVPDGAAPPPVIRPESVAPQAAADPEVLEVLAPDPATVDLAEAPRIVAGGVGLGGAEQFARLAEVATALGAAVGATRPIADAGYVAFERQIGTTGTAVHPDLYVALGISGAVQHVAGLGDPAHIISVNVDAACPMMGLADVAIVADAPAVVDALAERLGIHANG